MLKFFDIAQHMGAFTRIEFTPDDIVRSSLVKDYILAKLKYEDINEKCKRTWGYTSSLFGKEIEFANIPEGKFEPKKREIPEAVQQFAANLSRRRR